MSLKETLTNNRNEYWQGKIRASFEIISRYLEDYQNKEEYVSCYYDIKLVPIYDSEQDINIVCVINNKVFEIPSCQKNVIYFHNDITIRKYLELLAEKLEAEEFVVKYWCSDFIEELMKEDKEIILLDAVIELD